MTEQFLLDDGESDLGMVRAQNIKQKAGTLELFFNKEVGLNRRFRVGLGPQLGWNRVSASSRP